MSAEADQLIEDFPHLLGSLTYIECGDGWVPLIRKLCEDISRIQGNTKISVGQVKEKFGGLRFYLDATLNVEDENAMDQIHKLISKAESDSYHICERCGEAGKERNEGWIVTLCDKHHEERLERRKQQDIKYYKGLKPTRFDP
jgi:hypothetical protein